MCGGNLVAVLNLETGETNKNNSTTYSNISFTVRERCMMSSWGTNPNTVRYNVMLSSLPLMVRVPNIR